MKLTNAQMLKIIRAPKRSTHYVGCSKYRNLSGSNYCVCVLIEDDDFEDMTIFGGKVKEKRPYRKKSVEERAQVLSNNKVSLVLARARNGNEEAVKILTEWLKVKGKSYFVMQRHAISELLDFTESVLVLLQEKEERSPIIEVDEGEVTRGKILLIGSRDFKDMMYVCAAIARNDGWQHEVVFIEDVDYVMPDVSIIFKKYLSEEVIGEARAKLQSKVHLETNCSSSIGFEVVLRSARKKLSSWTRKPDLR